MQLVFRRCGTPNEIGNLNLAPTKPSSAPLNVSFCIRRWLRQSLMSDWLAVVTGCCRSRKIRIPCARNVRNARKWRIAILPLRYLANADRWRSQSSRDGSEMDYGRIPWLSGPLPKGENWSFLAHFLRRALLMIWMGPHRSLMESLRPGRGLICSELTLLYFIRALRSLKKCLLSNTTMQRLIVLIGNGALGSEKGVKFRPCPFPGILALMLTEDCGSELRHKNSSLFMVIKREQLVKRAMINYLPWHSTAGF